MILAARQGCSRFAACSSCAGASMDLWRFRFRRSTCAVVAHPDSLNPDLSCLNLGDNKIVTYCLLCRNGSCRATVVMSMERAQRCSDPLACHHVQLQRIDRALATQPNSNAATEISSTPRGASPARDRDSDDHAHNLPSKHCNCDAVTE